MAAMKAAISWSAGKDSCLALLRLREQGLAVPSFLTMCDEDGSSKSHALPPALVQAQVQALGGSSIRIHVPAGAYAACFAQALADLRASGHTHLVCGDIDLQAHRDWIEPMCQAAGLQALFPLWGQPRRQLAHEIIDRGIRARLVSVDLARLPIDFAGADYDLALLQRLPADVCPCGEDGEFHTFVWDAPGFSPPLVLRAGVTRRWANRPPLRAGEHALQIPELA